MYKELYTNVPGCRKMAGDMNYPKEFLYSVFGHSFFSFQRQRKLYLGSYIDFVTHLRVLRGKDITLRCVIQYSKEGGTYNRSAFHNYHLLLFKEIETVFLH